MMREKSASDKRVTHFFLSDMKVKAKASARSNKSNTSNSDYDHGSMFSSFLAESGMNNGKIGASYFNKGG